MWTLVFLVASPAAKIITVHVHGEPEHRELETYMERFGAMSAEVKPPTR